jgi:putative ABC transport system permease protein
MRTLLNDLLFALRQFRKTPVFVVAILAVLALGVGATAAIFTLFDQVLLRGLPVERPQELVRLQATSDSFSGHISSSGGDGKEYASYPAYRYLRENTGRIFSGVLATLSGTTVGVAWHDQTDLAPAELVSGNYFQVLGVPAAAGRLFQPADDVAKLGSPVTVLSYGYWQRQFGGNPAVIGQPLTVNGHVFTIVGVASPRFHSVVSGTRPDLFFPMTMKPVITPDWDDLDNYNSRWLNMVARLAPGVTLSQASAAAGSIWRAQQSIGFGFQKDQSPKNHAAYVDHAQIKLLPGATGFSPLRDQLDTPMKVLMGMAALVLLMACANVASLLLVRAAGRTREMSVRYALGAKRQRVLQQLIAEGLLLGVVGGALGLLLVHPVSTLLIDRIQGLSPGEPPYSAQLDPRLILFALAVTLGTSLLFSLAPAIQFWRPNLMPALKQQSVTTSGGPLLLRRAAVAVQIALSVLLLAAAGLFVRTVQNLRGQDLGFRADHLVRFGIDPRLAGYATGQVFALDQRILSTLRGLPGVRSAGASNDPELAGNQESTSLRIDGYKPSQDREMDTEWSAATPGYLETLDAPLIAGRNLSDSDRKDTQPVTLVSRSLAEHFFGSVQNALGRELSGGDSGTKPRSIVGVFGEIHHQDMRVPILRRAIHPALQDDPGQLVFVLRTAGDPAAMMQSVRIAMHQLDPKLALNGMATMDAQLDASLVQERTLSLLATSFGLLAALMSAVGLYGVLAFDTVQRTREIGVRMALGATRPQVARLLLNETLRLAGTSIAVGLPLAWAAAHAASSVLYNVPSADPVTYLGVALLVAVVALAASAIPTWRAASIEPTRALRYE